MKKTMIRATGLTLALGLAAIATAQPAPPPQPAAPAAPMPPGHPHMNMRSVHGAPGNMMHGMHMGWEKLSPAGRDIMRGAMRGPDDREQRRAARQALEERTAKLLAADKLDVAALKKVMSEKAAMRAAEEQRRQQALLDAYQRLTPADRKAVAEAMENRRAFAAKARDHARQHLQMMRDRVAKDGEAQKK